MEQLVEKLDYRVLSFSQAMLEQVFFDEKADTCMPKSKTRLRRPVDHTRLTGFETISRMDNAAIRKMMDRVKTADIIAGLVTADEFVKKAVLRNLDTNSREYVEINVLRFENTGVNDTILERSRNVISEAFYEMIREE